MLTQLSELTDSVLKWYNGVLAQWGYWVVGLLMAAESTVLPIPSELIIPPAADRAWKNGMDLLGVHFSPWPAEIMLVVAGALGSWVGAVLMYWVARVAGRPLMLRYGKYVLISPGKIEGAERWAAHYGPFGVFVSRLLPVVRHLIGIPAGIIRMNFVKYSLYTLAGAALWTAVLACLGVRVGAQLSKGERHGVTLTLVSFVAVVTVLYYFFVHRHMGKKPETSSSPSTEA